MGSAAEETDMDVPRGKVEEKIDHREVEERIIFAIMRRVSVQKKDRKNIMKAIQEVLAKYVRNVGNFLPTNSFNVTKSRYL